MQFINDNFDHIHGLNYLDYRFTPGMYFYHDPAEYEYIDSLMRTHYGLDLSEREEKIPVIWRNMDLANLYMPTIWWLWVFMMFTGIVMWNFNRVRVELIVMAATLIIPVVFHLVYISYRPRFLAPYIVLMFFLVLANYREVLRRKGIES
jgi:hypothetical protein